MRRRARSLEPDGSVAVGSPPGPASELCPTIRGSPPQGWNQTSPVAGSRYTAPERTRASAPSCDDLVASVHHPDLYRGLLHDVAAVQPIRVVPDRNITHDDARPRDRFQAVRACTALPTHGCSDAEDDGHSGRRRTRHQHPVAPNPSKSSAYVVGQWRRRHFEPRGDRVQPLDQISLVGVHAPSPSLTVAPNSAASARRNAARASLVWLFTVPVLMSRSAAVSSTLRPR